MRPGGPFGRGPCSPAAATRTGVPAPVEQSTCEHYDIGKDVCGRPAPKYRHTIRLDEEDENDQEIIAVCAKHACPRCTPPKGKA